MKCRRLLLLPGGDCLACRHAWLGACLRPRPGGASGAGRVPVAEAAGAWPTGPAGYHAALPCSQAWASAPALTAGSGRAPAGEVQDCPRAGEPGLLGLRASVHLRGRLPPRALKHTSVRNRLPCQWQGLSKTFSTPYPVTWNFCPFRSLKVLC